MLARIKGVGEVKLFGGSDYAMRVWVNPDRLSKLGLTVTDLVNAVQEQNLSHRRARSAVRPRLGNGFYLYRAYTGTIDGEQEFGNIVVRTNPDGSHQAT